MNLPNAQKVLLLVMCAAWLVRCDAHIEDDFRLAPLDGASVRDAEPERIGLDVVESEPPIPVCDGLFTPPTLSAEVRCSQGSIDRTVRCFDPGAPSLWLPDQVYTGHPNIKEHVVGANGELLDACTADGNLVEATCEVVSGVTGGQGAVGAVWMETGIVLPFTVDCAGRCVDGRCPQSYPIDEGFVRVIRRDTERVRLRACRSGLDYDCRIPVLQPATHDCDMALVPEVWLPVQAGCGQGTETSTAALPPVWVGYPTECRLDDCRLELPETMQPDAQL